jgi:hypothetical protein
MHFKELKARARARDNEICTPFSVHFVEPHFNQKVYEYSCTRTIPSAEIMDSLVSFS